MLFKGCLRCLRSCPSKGEVVGLRSFSSSDDILLLRYLGGNDNGIAVIGLNREERKNSFSKSMVKKTSSSKEFAFTTWNSSTLPYSIESIVEQCPCVTSMISDRALLSHFTSGEGALVFQCHHESLYEAVSAVEHDKQVRTLVIRSLVPRIFSAGADLKEGINAPVNTGKPCVPRLGQVFAKFRSLPFPVIAALDGTAVGGGLEMALCCDFRIAANTAKMGLVETSLAMPPGVGGTQKLPRLVGPAKAKELIFTAKVIDGEEAEKIGLVNCSVPQNDNHDAAYQRSLELAREILPNGPVAVHMAKLAIDRGLEVDLESGLAFEGAFYAQTIPTKDRMEGLMAFKEKRKPVYKGE